MLKVGDKVKITRTDWFNLSCWELNGIYTVKEDPNKCFFISCGIEKFLLFGKWVNYVSKVPSINYRQVTERLP